MKKIKVIIEIDKNNFEFESSMPTGCDSNQISCIFKLLKDLTLKHELHMNELEEELEESIKEQKIKEITKEISNNLSEIEGYGQGCHYSSEELEFEILEQWEKFIKVYKGI